MYVDANMNKMLLLRSYLSFKWYIIPFQQNQQDEKTLAKSIKRNLFLLLLVQHTICGYEPTKQ